MHDQEGDTEPAHHARRPMNAFLIFCKRHRSVVREKYPNLENRSITKILGEWWANLDKEEKACYTGLAKQYKDAFFSANPDFKWYKLPAPPLRTLSSRPREPPEPAAPDDPDDSERTNNNSTKLDLNKKPDLQLHGPKLSMFTPGKLADEAHMGGLSSLLEITESYYASCVHNQISENYYTPQEQGPSNNETNELQNALSETSKIFEKDFDKKQQELARRIQQNDLFTNQDMIDQIVEKRYSKDDDCLQKNSSDDEKSAKSGRSCKGKRYQEFMAVGGLIVNKRHKRDYPDKSPEEMYAASCSWDPGTVVADEEVVSYIETPDMPHDHATIEIETKSDPSDFIEAENNGYKSFKAADFDLDSKIKALPSLSLEKFQERKRENKRKKKTLNLRPKTVENAHIVNSVPMSSEERREPELSREAAIGSQKRKPRKISITRLEINSLVSNTNVTGAYKISPEIKLAMEAPYSVLQKLEMSSQPAHEGLLALATLAEVAANTSKIEGTSLATAVPSPSDEHASKV